MEDLKKNIEDLIELKKEGQYWDFKLKYSPNSLDLIKDIICMANCEHCGDRYLIYGVRNDSVVVGLNNEKRRMTQNDIINVLSEQSFAAGNVPDVSLDTIFIQDKEVDVITVKNHPKKPYYLVRPKQEKDVCLRAGAVYSRVQDRNTSNNQQHLMRVLNECGKNLSGFLSPH